MTSLPRAVGKVHVPPIKCQGIKTKLVHFICSNIQWPGRGRWMEPFLGSGVVLFNVCPDRALATDANIHIINLYKDIQAGRVTGRLVGEYLHDQGGILSKRGEDYYYEVRERFNLAPNSLDFLFLNRSCFNGIMRFNKNARFNVPFGHKPGRFAQAYITKIVNQVLAVAAVMKDRDWQFEASDWRGLLHRARDDDFVYLDPPYIGRHTDYFNQWSEKDAVELSQAAKNLPCGFALSMWLENIYRRNRHIDECWHGMAVRTFTHFYHVGSTEDLRNEMEEALIIKPGYEA